MAPKMTKVTLFALHMQCIFKGFLCPKQCLLLWLCPKMPTSALGFWLQFLGFGGLFASHDSNFWLGLSKSK